MPRFKTGKLNRTEKKFIESLDDDELAAVRARTVEILGVAVAEGSPRMRRLKEIVDLIDQMPRDAIFTFRTEAEVRAAAKRLAKKKPKKGRRK